MSTWIKFCGTTSVEDALASVDAGANALGFIFAPSKRRVSIEKAREIIRELPASVERIGVFLDTSPEDIVRCVVEVRLTGFQLHGSESPAEVASLLGPARKDLRVIKTAVVKDGARLSFPADSQGIDVWLLDSGAGSGKTFDWQVARAQLGEHKGKFIIAGGLTSENVGEAIHVFSPWGVDVVSGIEHEPGRKDPQKMNAFVAAVRKAEQQ